MLKDFFIKQKKPIAVATVDDLNNQYNLIEIMFAKKKKMKSR